MRGDLTLVRQRPYPIPQAKIEKVKEELQAMLDLDVIEESNSPWSTPYVMVPKPDGTTRFCVNFKKVNSFSKFDAYLMPRIEELIRRLGSSRYITKGYWQVPLTERSKQYTAFSTPMGLYQFKYLPFGLQCTWSPSNLPKNDGSIAERKRGVCSRIHGRLRSIQHKV